MKRTLVLSLGVAAVALGGMAIAFPYAAGYYARVSVENIFKRARNEGAKIAAYNSIETNIWEGEVVLNGVVLESSGADATRLTMDTFRTHFPWEINGTVSAGLVQVTNLAISSGDITYTLPEVSVEDFVFRSKEKATSTSAIKSFLKRIDASEVTSPEWKTVQKGDGERIIKGLEITGLDHGKAESMRFESLSGTSKGENGNTVSVNAGEGVYSAIDMAALAAIYTDSTNEKAPLEELIGQTEVKNFVVKGFSDKPDETMEIESFSLKNLRGRTLAFPFSTLVALNARLADNQEPTPEDLQLYSTVASEVADGFSLDTIAMTNMRVHDTAEKANMSIGKMSLDTLEKGKLGNFALDDVVFNDSKIGTMKFSFTVANLDFSPSLAFLKSEADQANGKAQTTTSASPFIHVPTFSRLTLNKFEVKNDDLPFSFDEIAVDTSNHINGLPLQASFTVKGGRYTRIGSGNDVLGVSQALKSMGLDKSATDYSIGYRWDEATKNLTMDNVIFSVENAGNIQINGGVGPVEKSVFAGTLDQEFMQKLVEIEVLPVTLTFNDSGLTNKLFSYFAKELEVDEGDLRENIKEQVIDINNEILGETLNRQSIVAIQNFIDKPASLTLTLEPKEPLKAMEAYMAYQLAPEALLTLFDASVK